MMMSMIINKKFKDLNPIQFGEEECNPSHSFGPAIREFYLLHFVVSGKGILYADGREYKINENNIFVIRPGEVTTYKADSIEPWHYIWIGFDGELARSAYILKQRIIPYKGTAFKNMTALEAYGSAKEEYLVSSLFCLLAELESEKTVPGEYVRAARDYILSDYMNEISVKEIAKKIGIDRSYLSKLFHKQMNISIRSFLINVRMQKAAEFLKEGYTVGEASELCGYDDMFVFSRTFKKHYGKPPIIFRNGKA